MKKIVLLILMLAMFISASSPAGYATGGNAEELYADGMRYYNAAEYEHAFSYFLISGDRKDYAPAQNMLGVCYRDGLGTEQDLEEAERYFQLSADQGYESAQENLAALAEARDTESNEKQQAYLTAMNLYFAGEYEAAKAVFETLGEYEHSADFLALCDNALQKKQEAGNLSAFNDVKAGDIIEFGSYEQDNDLTNGAEPIEWQVLDVQDGKALLFSRYALNCQQYNNTRETVTWESCTLRTWLNNAFLNDAFNMGEQRRIRMTTVSADKNPDYSTDPGKATQDKVFLLSITEANKYFTSNSERACAGTAYCYAQGADESSDTGKCWWWLRSPGYYSNIAAIVTIIGAVFSNGYVVDYDNIAVRPALWIDLST